MARHLREQIRDEQQPDCDGDFFEHRAGRFRLGRPIPFDVRPKVARVIACGAAQEAR
jgi:hypothetical protein